MKNWNEYIGKEIEITVDMSNEADDLHGEIKSVEQISNQTFLYLENDDYIRYVNVEKIIDFAFLENDDEENEEDY